MSASQVFKTPRHTPPASYCHCIVVFSQHARLAGEDGKCTFCECFYTWLSNSFPQSILAQYIPKQTHKWAHKGTVDSPLRLVTHAAWLFIWQTISRILLDFSLAVSIYFSNVYVSFIIDTMLNLC